jgi:hypothetical protein
MAGTRRSGTRRRGPVTPAHAGYMKARPTLRRTRRTNGDLPTNPMCLRECLVGGEVFNRTDSLAHTEIPCQPSSQQPARKRKGISCVAFTDWCLRIRFDLGMDDT